MRQGQGPGTRPTGGQAAAERQPPAAAVVVKYETGSAWRDLDSSQTFLSAQSKCARMSAASGYWLVELPVCGL